MKACIAVLAAVTALASLPAQAGDRHYGLKRHWSAPTVHFGYVYGGPFLRYGHGHRHAPRRYSSRPYLSPNYSSFGWGIGIGFPHRVYRTRSNPPAAAEVRGPSRLFVYPAAGQSEAQTAEDRYQCHVWAAEQSDFDPTLGGGSVRELADYNRAFVACMEGRDYVVK